MTDVRILTEALGGSPLSALIQRGEAPASWFVQPPSSPDGWKEWARSRAREQEWSARLDALAPAFSATGAAADRLDRVRREGGVVVTTGQQPGLFGGPVYTWSKALGALAFADALERATGIATAAVFWSATDDADFAEASSTVISRVGGAETICMAELAPVSTPMTLVPLGDLSGPMIRLADAAGSVADPRAMAAVHTAYGNASCTVGDAYTALLRELLAPLGVSVLDASHPAVRAASEPVLRAALLHAEGIAAAVVARGKDIRTRGLDPQVEEMPDLSLVFAREGAVRRRLSNSEAGNVSRDAWLTPNVLLRAIVERDILPTVAYFAGPGELAYFAQVTAVSQALGTPAPVAVPRWSCTLVEPNVDQLLTRFGVAPSALAQPDALEGMVARAAMSDDASRALSALREQVEGLPTLLAQESAALGLSAAVSGSVQALLHRLDRLERRLVAGIKRREVGLLRDVGTLRGALYPLGTRQERMVNLVPILARHGLGLLAEMRDAATAHAHWLIDGLGRSS